MEEERKRGDRLDGDKINSDTDFMRWGHARMDHLSSVSFGRCRFFNKTDTYSISVNFSCRTGVEPVSIVLKGAPFFHRAEVRRSP